MKYVYSFKDGNKDMRDLLGGKGANLAEMTNIGLPVPQGFTVTTDVCKEYIKSEGKLSSEILSQIDDELRNLENISGKKFGNYKKPLLVSVRSGSPISMPGMMDTILNLGLNDEIVEKYAVISENARFVFDSYRRLIQMYSDVVMNLPKSSFERKLDDYKQSHNIELDTELTIDNLKEIINIYKEEYKKLVGKEFPQSPYEQLLEAVKAVFRSWNNERAITYRKLNNISDSLGTAVNVQEMVYGNMGDDCGTGVAFTRNPATGEKKLFGEYLINAQGEDVVAGIRTPESIDKLKVSMPECFKEFERICNVLEKHYKDMQDMEFTIEHNKLFMLQTRNGKRTGQAAVKIAVDLVSEGMISKAEAILRVEPESLNQLLHPTFDKDIIKDKKAITKGLAASPGAATGKIYFDEKSLIKAHDTGEKDLILVRLETSPEDIEGMTIANGILTVRGGMTSHAAVVARGMGTCCVSGCSEVSINEKNKTMTVNDITLNEGDWISLDGSTGFVYGEKLETKDAEISGDFGTFMSWTDEFKKLDIRANADTPKNAIDALKLGAKGIGLCRTEHMFFSKERIFNFRKMICSETKEEREKALDNILPFQQSDFEKLFETMNGFPVTIRYLDPPLHEFLPKTESEIEALATSLNITYDKLKARIDSLKEFNPMMGHRGCRLDITYPEIAKMQTKAVIMAAISSIKKGIIVKPEIMIPLVGDINELKFVKDIVNQTANEILEQENIKLDYKVGTMIEIPRAVVIADKLAEEAEFFSFGTNDLTQLTYGFSRDDSPKFIKDYFTNNIFKTDPFKSVDEEGVGALVQVATNLGRKTRKDIELGVCGEHAGDPQSIEFFNKIGLDYVSCSPFRVPVARLAAARSAIKQCNSK